MHIVSLKEGIQELSYKVNVVFIIAFQRQGESAFR